MDPLNNNNGLNNGLPYLPLKKSSQNIGININDTISTQNSSLSSSSSQKRQWTKISNNEGEDFDFFKSAEQGNPAKRQKIEKINEVDNPNEISMLPSEHGKKALNDGNLYEGEMYLGEAHGKGRITTKTGIIYEGEIRNGAMHGKGKMTLPI